MIRLAPPPGIAQSPFPGGALIALIASRSEQVLSTVLSSATVLTARMAAEAASGDARTANSTTSAKSRQPPIAMVMPVKRLTATEAGQRLSLGIARRRRQA